MKSLRVLSGSALFCVLALLLFHTAQLQAQQTSRGKDFYFSFLPNLHNGGLQSGDTLYVYVVADSVTTGTLTYRNRAGATFTQSINITDPTKIWQYQLQWNGFELLGYNQSTQFSTNNDLETPASQVFHVQTNRAVAVYALNKAQTTSDATLVFPTEFLGKDYWVMSYKADGVTQGSTLDLQYTPSEFCVIATDSNTVVSVTPTAPTTESGNSVKNFSLQKGEAYLFQSQFSTSNIRLDLTGTHVQSSKPVAVFSGHQRATLPVELRGQLISRDHLYEQLTPTGVWGRSYVITPLGQPSSSGGGGNDLWRVVAQDDGTILNFNNTQVAVLNRGQYYEAALVTPGLLVASKKVQVAFFKKTHSYNQNLQPGDPFMMIIPPRRQYLTEYRFTNIESTPNFYEQFITVVTTKANQANVLLDGVKLNASWLDIPNTCFSYANVRVSSANHKLTSSQPVGLYVYGYGDADSYGYVGGMALQPDLAEVDIDAGPDRTICLGDTAQMRVVGGASKAKWTPSTGLNCDTCLTVIAKPTQNTSYIVTVLDSLGCTQIDTVNIAVRKFQINAGKDTSMCPGGDSVKLSVVGVNGAILRVNWQPKIGLSCDTCTTTLAHPAVTTNYIAVAIDSLGCIGRDTVKVTIRPGLQVDAGPDQEFCSAADSVTLKVTMANGVIKKVKWSPSTGIGCDTCIQTKARPNVGTTYYVTVFDSSGCSGIDSIKFKLKSNSGAVHLSSEIYICDQNDSAALQIQGKIMSVKWTPSTGVSCDTCPLTYAKPKVTTTYYCSGVDALGCLFKDSVKVVPLPKATVDIQPDSVVCTSTGVALRAMGSFLSVYWTPTLGLSCTTCPTPVAIPPQKDMTYYVHARNGNSPDCEAIDSVTVKYRPGIEGQLPTVVNTCLGDTLRYSIKYGGKVLWVPSTNLSCDTCKDQVLVPKGNIKYTITGDSAGCTSKITLDVKLSQRASIAAPKDTSLCRGDTIVLRATSNSTTNPIEWSPYVGLDCPTCLTPKASPRKTTTYVVTSGSGGCASRDTITITVKDRPVAQISPQDTSLCNGGSVQYRLTLATTGSLLQWSPPEGLSCTDCPNPVATPTKSGINTYTLTIVGPNGCDTNIVTTIGVGAAPRDTLLNKDTSFCEGSALITRFRGDTSVAFVWTPKQGVSCETCARTEIRPDSSRTYYVLATDKSSGCSKLDSLHVTVHALPKHDSISADQTICQKQSTKLHVNAASSYKWTPSTGLDRDDIQEPTASPSTTTTYTVMLRNASGCTDSARVTINVQPCGDSLQIQPTAAITPILACDTSLVSFIIRNLGQIAIRIDSVSIIRTVNADVDPAYLASENVLHFPDTLQPNERHSPDFRLRILPRAEGSYTVVLRVHSENKTRIDSLVLNGTSYQLAVLFKLDSTSVTVDSSFIFPVEGYSKYWKELAIRGVDATISYDSHFMQLDTSVALALGDLTDATWSAKYDDATSVAGTARFVLRGTTPLSSKSGTSGSLFKPHFRTYLAPELSTRPTLSYTLPTLRVDCAERFADPGQVQIATCAGSLRRIVASLNTFELKYIAPNPVNSQIVEFRYSIGFACPVSLKLYDDLGREVQSVVSGQLEGGEYSLLFDSSTLANGTYHCVLTAAGYRFSKIMSVVR